MFPINFRLQSIKNYYFLWWSYWMSDKIETRKPLFFRTIYSSFM